MKKSFLSLFVAALALFCGFMQPAVAKDPRVNIFSKTHDFADTADGAQATTTVTAPGSLMGDACLATVGVSAAGTTITCYISAAGTATVVLQNESGGSVNLASTTLRVFVFSKGTR